MSARPMPRWMKEVQRKLLAKPGLTAKPSADWEAMRDAEVGNGGPAKHPPMYDCPEAAQPFLPEDDMDKQAPEHFADAVEAAWGIETMYAEMQAALPCLVGKPGFDIVMRTVQRARATVAKARAD